MLQGRVLVTGGAGFLARAIYRRATAEDWPAEFTCLSRDDSKHAALQARFPHVETVQADVGLTDVDYLEALMRGFDVVIHAAASKHVDRSESHAFATIRTNVEGSRRVAAAALGARVGRVIGISTDKAVQPSNVYGCTKMAMERLFQEADRLGTTRFHIVRYGNVISSTGSVITLFQRWLAEEQPIRLTDPRMTRFWMGVDEAIDLIDYALRQPRGGEVILPKMRAMPMHDLVRTMLGYNEHGTLDADVAAGRVQIIGTRPGEKRHESLMHEQESVRAVERERGYVHLAPPDSRSSNTVPWSITSDHPPGGWMGVADMRALIEDAAEV